MRCIAKYAYHIGYKKENIDRGIRLQLAVQIDHGINLLLLQRKIGVFLGEYEYNMNVCNFKKISQFNLNNCGPVRLKWLTTVSMS